MSKIVIDTLKREIYRLDHDLCSIDRSLAGLKEEVDGLESRKDELLAIRREYDIFIKNQSSITMTIITPNADSFRRNRESS